MPLASANIVIAARQFNPSVFTQLWLVRNQIVAENEFESGCLFSDAVTQIKSSRFSLVVLPEQLQFLPKHPDGEQELISEKLGAILRLLPHTPYVAMGLNLVWQEAPEGQTIPQWTRELFWKEDTFLGREFDVEDAHFGAYFSKNALGFRMKLDIKPIDKQTPAGVEHLLQYLFNFHLALAPDRDPVEQLTTGLARWTDAKQLAEHVLEGASRRQAV